jgi:hypothetical protein
MHLRAAWHASTSCPLVTFALVYKASQQFAKATRDTVSNHRIVANVFWCHLGLRSANTIKDPVMSCAKHT